VSYVVALKSGNSIDSYFEWPPNICKPFFFVAGRMNTVLEPGTQQHRQFIIDSDHYVDYRRHMDTISTVKSLGALAQESRLAAFRLLVRRGVEGMAAGEIARALSIPHNTMSSHLAIMANAGLVTSRRESRSIIYSIDFGGTRELLSFLMEDCCQGQPELCAPVLDSVLPGCCAPNSSNGENHETSAR
jgi:DNA-binding transcriptional ArsR family regulator